MVTLTGAGDMGSGSSSGSASAGPASQEPSPPAQGQPVPRLEPRLEQRLEKKSVKDRLGTKLPEATEPLPSKEDGGSKSLSALLLTLYHTTWRPFTASSSAAVLY